MERWNEKRTTTLHQCSMCWNIRWVFHHNENKFSLRCWIFLTHVNRQNALLQASITIFSQLIASRALTCRHQGSEKAINRVEPKRKKFCFLIMKRLHFNAITNKCKLCADDFALKSTFKIQFIVIFCCIDVRHVERKFQYSHTKADNELHKLNDNNK